MKRGKTQAETLHLNDWSIGDILEGTESNDSGWSNTNRILITCIGDHEFLCRWDYNDGKGFDRPETGNTTLFCREWKKVGEDEERKSRAGFWGRVAHRLTRKKVNLRKALQDILLKSARSGGELYIHEPIFRFGPLAFFRSDLSTHAVHLVEKGTRYVLSFGVAI